MINHHNEKEQLVWQLFGNYTQNIVFSWLANQNLRRKIVLQINQQNILGEFLPKTHQHSPLIFHPLAEEKINIFLPKLQDFLNCFAKNFISQIKITSFDNVLDVVFIGKKSLSYQQKQALTSFAFQQNINLSWHFLQQQEPLFVAKPCFIAINDLNLQVNNEVFLQASKGGLQTICNVLSNFIADLEIKSPAIADLYCGFGIYSFALHQLIKESQAFDGSQTMIDLANKNSQKQQLTNKIKAHHRDLFFNPLTQQELNKFTAIIINPPRNGASPQVLQIAKSQVKNVCYVSCNPYSLLTDLKILLDYNYRINTMHGINQFADSKNIELVVNLTKQPTLAKHH